MNQPLSIRPTAVAGSFYPKNTSQLNSMLEEYLSIATVEIAAPKAIIAPHAGYIYSGQIAASVYSNLVKLKTKITRVVLLGPTHRVYVRGLALPGNTHFASPLGNVPVDTDSLKNISTHPFVQFLDEAHEQEHSLEVHIPFLQKVLNNFVLLPVLVGDATPEQVATILEELWGGDETLIVISSDLSHYLDYETACKTDNDTTHLIEKFDYKNIGSKQACGCMPMRGLLKLAQEKNMSIKTVDLRNSGDTAGTKDRVVGYGAYALFENRILNKEDEALIFNIIHKSIEQGFKTGKAFEPETKDVSEHLKKNYAVFITLKLNGQLRGCIGTTEAHAPLIDAVAHYAHAAAFSDPRFKPLTEEEYKHVEISLSILTPASPLPFADEQDLLAKLRPGVDGLIISKNNARATFLPVVWESLKESGQFLNELKRKAGIAASDSPEKAWRYTAEYYN
ncbi:MAG: AmmeMemoRadiSam system protein B [Proteobacteria bacterium]|nr:AmmeMemoRadiSam system protein B [Pseudomonadota bacterium]